MNPITTKQPMDSLRIIWAISQKDLLDAFRSKSIITIFLTGLFLIVLYNALPAISNANEKPVLAVLTTGDNTVLERLEDNKDFTTLLFVSQNDFDSFIGSEENKVIGIVFPDNFETTLQEQNIVSLQGVVDHWLTQKQLDNIQIFFEEQLTTIFEKPVQIEVNGHTVYTNLNAFFIFNHGLALVVILMLMGTFITPNIMIEERLKKTMDALLLSPASPGMVTLSKALTSLIFCLTGTLLALIIYNRYIVHWEIMIAGFLAGALFFIALGLLMGVLLYAPQQMTVLFLVAQPLIIPMALSFAQGVFPPLVDQIIDWTPTGALIDVFKYAMIANFPGDAYLKIGLVFAYALVIFALVAWKLNRSDR